MVLVQIAVGQTVGFFLAYCCQTPTSSYLGEKRAALQRPLLIGIHSVAGEEPLVWPQGGACCLGAGETVGTQLFLQPFEDSSW